ncbi:MAG: nuclear transport factor 2 family protein [Mycobacteriales bacterium]
MQADEVRALVAQYFDCANNDDFEGLAKLFHEDAVSRPVNAPPLVGRDAVLTMYPQVLAPFPVHCDDPVRILVSGQTAAVNIHFTGTMTDGKVIEFDAVDVIEYEDGLIRRISYWYDEAAIIADMTSP